MVCWVDWSVKSEGTDQQTAGLIDYGGVISRLAALTKVQVNKANLSL